MIKRFLVTIAALGLGLAAPVETVLAKQPTAKPAPGFTTQVLALPAAEMPGYPSFGREPLMAVRYTPASGERMHSAAIVFVDNGPGAHPLDPDSATRFAAERLAARGYTVLSLFTRTARSFVNMPFKAGALDVAAALDYLEAQGHEDLILAGQGLGTSLVAYYIANEKDAALDMPGAKRVKAAILLSPPADEPRQWGELSKDYDARIAQAQRLVAESKQAHTDPLYAAPMMSANQLVQTPAMFLDYWGPDADTRLSKWMPKIAVPVLIVAGGADKSVPAGRIEELKRLAPASTSVEVIAYPNGDKAFTGLRDQTSADIAKWLTQHKLDVKPDVTIQVLDATMGDGSRQAGTFYAPATGADPKKPVFVLQHGTAGDVLHSATQWLAWRLAEAGYAVLSPRTRMSGGRGLQVSTYAESAVDLGKWVDVLAAKGLNKVVLEGHSLGGMLVSNYAATGDPRVVGLIYMAPTRDSPTRAREGAGEERYAALVKRADDAVKSGEGAREVINFLSYPEMAKDNYKPGEGRKPVSGDTALAQHFLDFRGPNALIHTEVIRKIKVPALAFSATGDPLMTHPFIEDFASKYGGKFEVVWYEGTHGARESKDLVAKNILDWAKKYFPQ